MNSNIVLIEIRKRYLVDYVKSIFNTKPNEIIQIDLSHPIGQHIFAMVFHFPYEYPRKKTPADVPFRISSTHCNTKSDLHFMHVFRWGEESIRQYLESIFTLDFEQWIFFCEKLGMDYKDAIERFMERRGLKPENCDFETLKKRNYRFRTKLINDIQFANDQYFKQL